MEIFLFWYGAACELQLASYGPKTVSKMLCVLVWTLVFHAQFNNFVYTKCGTYSQATPGLLLKACITGCDKYARN